MHFCPNYLPGEDYAEGIRQFLKTKKGTIPADATLGKALKIEQGKDSIFEHLAKGGEVGYVIVVLGLICLLLGILKIIDIVSFRVPSPEQVQSVLNHIEQDEVEKAKAASDATLWLSKRSSLSSSIGTFTSVPT